MPQSLSNILIHIVFSTKNREPLIARVIAPDLYRYIASISEAHHCPSHQLGGTEDHVHMCCSLARTQTCARLVEEVKTGSSKWMKGKGVAGFAWQNGYGAFSVGEEQLEALRNYVENQPGHHARVSLEDELRELSRRYCIPYDERYVWE
ncbi:MAG: IS200/IS605 family transposase [Armatimonadota bacterium]